MKNKHMIIGYSLWIALLNMIDGIATNYGLMHHFIKELNPLMNAFWQVSPLLFLGTKLALSMLIFYTSYLIYRKSHATFQQRYFYSLVGVFVLYVAIGCTHITWLSLI